MKIKKLIINNYKLFQKAIIDMNKDINIFVGENNAGKTTILEALGMVLTGKINGINIINCFNLDWFNIKTRNDFKCGIEEKNNPTLPSIEIEAYFDGSEESEVTIKKFRGTNNSLREDAVGVKLEIAFDNQYSEIYLQLLDEKNIKDIPIEYYKVIFRSFANPEYYPQATAKKVACIDTTKKDYGSVLNRFVSSTINNYLTETDITELRHVYRENRDKFTDNQVVKQFNEKLKKSHNFDGKTVSLNLKEGGIDEWRGDMSISLDGIPLENIGFGTQNMFKSEIFLLQNSEVDILIIEEPENNLSYANMSVLISKLSESNGKQLFISTHSSFVANKLGLQYLFLISNGIINSFKGLPSETYNYFLKLPVYNTLRILLSKKVILVEDPADELIIQRAYIDYYGKQPIENGIDIISVGGVAFKSYCELAALINKPLIIVTDNDGNVKEVQEKYNKYTNPITLCVESDNNLNTLEPSVLNANLDDFELFKSIIYKGNKKIDCKEKLEDFMIKNKTTWSMRVFTDKKRIKYPKYILKAIGKDSEGNNIDG